MMSISNLKFGELAWAAVPFVLALIGALAVLTFVPEITLWAAEPASAGARTRGVR